MSGRIEIRPARAGDAAAIAAIQREARLNAMPWLPIMHTPAEELSFFAGRISDGECCMIAEVDGEAAGFINFERDWVHHVYIRPAHWRRGLGAQLLNLAKASSPELQLWTFQGNAAARAFYAAQGFEEVEFTDGAGNEERTPDVRLVWTST